MKKLFTFFTLYVAFAAAQIPGYVPASGLQAYWPFTGNANDLGPGSYNGTVNGALLTSDRSGNPNSAYSFNGSNAYITTNYAGILGSNARAVSFWARSSVASTPMAAVSWGTGSQANCFSCNFNYNTTGPTFDAAYGAITYSTIANSSANNAWHHYVFQFNGTYITQVEVYQDAILLNVVTTSYNPTDIINTLQNINVQFGKMASIPSAPDYFNGQLDDIGIWNRKLSLCEIMQLYTASLPSISIMSSNSLVCPGQSATLTASGAVTYTWSNAANTNSIIIAPVNNTTYTLTGTNTSGCTAFTSITQSVALCEGIATITSPGAGIKIYPNPGNGSFTLNSEVAGSIDIYNNQGRLVYHALVNNDKMEIDLSGQPNGIYFLKITGDQPVDLKKIIKD